MRAVTTLGLALTLVIAAAAGFANGLLIAYVRLQSIIVTIATLFIFSGITLKILDQPGGSVPRGFQDLLTGVTVIPRALIVILLGAVAWLALRRTRQGAAMYAIGGDREAARMSGIPISRRLLVTYTLAGVFYDLRGRRAGARRAAEHVRQALEAAARLMATTTAPTRSDERPLDRAGRALRAVPWAAVWLAIVVLWIASRWIVGPGFQSLDNIWAVVTAASFIAVAAAGQGLVILTGGIDLSIPWMMTLGGVLIAKWTNGQNDALIWALPALLAIGAALGAINGAGITFLGIAPVIITIAMNSIAQGIVLLSTNGTPTGSAPPLLRDLMVKKAAGIR